MADDKVYIRSPKWWPKIIPYSHVLQLLKSIYGTKQAAWRWHVHISLWMEANGYLADNSEETNFMKQINDDINIHAQFVNDMMHIPTNNALREEHSNQQCAPWGIHGQIFQRFWYYQWCIHRNVSLYGSWAIRWQYLSSPWTYEGSNGNLLATSRQFRRQMGSLSPSKFWGLNLLLFLQEGPKRHIVDSDSLRGASC